MREEIKSILKSRRSLGADDVESYFRSFLPNYRRPTGERNREKEKLSGDAIDAYVDAAVDFWVRSRVAASAQRRISCCRRKSLTN